MPQLRAFAVLFCLGAPLGLAAEEPGGTLKKIKDSGVIALGHRESSIPFSYYDDKQQVVGYSQDIALRVVDAVKQELKLPSVQVKLVPVTSQNRIPLVQNGTVDIECGSTTNNLERQKQVAFSNTIFIVSLKPSTYFRPVAYTFSNTLTVTRSPSDVFARSMNCLATSSV